MNAPLHTAATVFVRQGLFSRLSSFSELEQRIQALSTEQDRGNAFEVFAEAYLATQQITQTRHVWPLAALPQEVRSHLALTRRDMGIDGVIETTLGEYDAYQVKFRTGRSALTWEELGTFMGLSDKARQRILFTNSNDLPAVINERTGFFCIRGNDLDRLVPRDFDVIVCWLSTGKIQFKRKEPLPHQNEAIGALQRALKEQERVTSVMACGSGKTLVELWVAERGGYQNVLVLVPSLALVRQTLHEWLRETSWPSFACLCVCSDPTVTKGTDEFIVHQSDLDFPVTTEPAAVQSFLNRPFDGVRVVFSTYQSAEVVAKGSKGLAPFDLGIFDEAHKTAGREGARFGFALRDRNLPIRNRLFLTATPRHYDVRSKDKEGDKKLVYSMDSPEVYGPVAYTLTFAEAARRGIICGYKILISIVTSEMVNEHLLRHGEVLVEGEVVKAQQVANQIAIQKAVEQYEVKRIFTFHPKVASAKSFVVTGGEGIGAHLPMFKTFHVNGAMRTVERDALMEEFRLAERALMTNARCLTEGVDVPAVDMVAFMSPRKSRVDIVQATGRAMRRSPAKNVGYVLVPVYLEQARGESVEDAVSRSDFEAVWDVLEALQEQDDVLADVIKQMREQRGRTGGFDDQRFRERVEVLGPTISVETLRLAITAQCMERLGSTWDEYFGQLVAYKERFGDCDVPKGWPENVSFAAWVSMQRVLYGHKKLSAERIARLEAVGFVWSMRDSQWEEMFEALSAYKKRFGNCNVPQRWPENTELGKWCHTQRYAYKGRVRSALNAERIVRLEALGFIWDTLDRAWEKMFQNLVEYKKRFGDCNVPQRWSENPALGRWCFTQRVNYRKGELSSTRAARLEEVGFVWRQLDSRPWEEMFDALADYKARFGHCNVPQLWAENPRLGRWCNTQRQVYKANKMSVDRVSRLEALGFDWIAPSMVR
jgi:predicted helicase